MVEALLKRCFLRTYASKVRPGGFRWPLQFAPFDEAELQTTLIVCLPLAGLLSALSMAFPLDIVRQMTPLEAKVGFSIFALAMALLVNVLVRRLLRGYRTAMPDIADFSSTRDRLIMNIQFAIVLLGSVAMPWLAAWVTGTLPT